MNGQASVDAVVVGAGPTGLVIARELAARGIKVRLIDKLAKPSLKSRALVVHARSLELFQKMNLAQEFLDNGRRTIGIRIFVEGRPAAAVKFIDIGTDDTPYPYVLMISQAETEAILTKELLRLGVSIERPVALAGFTQDSAGVTVTLQHGDAVERVRCRYLIGCDGAHSLVRHELGLRFTGAPYDQEFLLADARLEKWPHSYDDLMIFVSLKGILVHFPLRGRAMSRLVMSRVGHKEEIKEVMTTKDIELSEAEEAARHLTATEVRLEQPEWLANFHLHHRAVDRYSAGRVFVAGDAAHIHSPAGGQGMNTGIQDAYNLAWKMALVLKGIAPAALLDSYHDERFPVGQFLLQRTDRLFEAMVSRNKTFLLLRNLLLPSLARFILAGPPAIRRRAFRFISQLGIRYRASHWIADDAGRRAPNGKVGQNSLFEMMKAPTFYLLCFGNAEPKGLDTRLVTPLLLERPEAADVFDRYGIAKGEGYCLIRPDGYIAYQNDGDAAAVIQFMDRFRIDHNAGEHIHEGSWRSAKVNLT
jgi:2-polyprenyl-6-methoxyphenol hydroxylase-like FAD-dependent oxidoreductase